MGMTTLLHVPAEFCPANPANRWLERTWTLHLFGWFCVVSFRSGHHRGITIGINK
jgi:hypothetical protein